MITTIKQVLEQKHDTKVWCVRPDELVINALKLMAQHNIGAVLVREGDQILGMLTERDYSRKIVLYGKSSASTKVRDVMGGPVLFVTPDDSVEGVLALMTQRRLRHLPVLHDGFLIGLISMGDVVKAIISEQEFLIDQLTRYIVGSYTDNIVMFPTQILNADERLLAS